MFEDSRAKFIGEKQKREISKEYLSPIPLCPDKNNLLLIPFNDPYASQLKKLKKAEFLDEINNIKYNLDKKDIDVLANYLNDEARFISYLTQKSISEDDARVVYYEVHKANKGPIKNISKYYPNQDYTYRFSSIGPNSKFEGSGKFDRNYSLDLLNDTVMLNPAEATLEFWISPIVDTLNDKMERIYFDARDVVEEIVTSKDAFTIILKESAKQIIDVKLLNSDDKIISGDITDELERSQITGILNEGTGVSKSFHNNYRLQDKEIKLFEPLLKSQMRVKVRYIPKSSFGDYIRIYKDKNSNLVLKVQTNNNLRTISTKIRWTENSWHKILFAYNRESKNIFFVVDGKNVTDNINYNINFKDILNQISIGGLFEQVSMSRIANLRISRKQRNIIRNIEGSLIDQNFNSQISLNNPLLKDDLTTLIINFDNNLDINQNFASIYDPINGIYNFDVNVDNGFLTLNEELEDLIEDLINRLKPAHTNVVVNFNDDRC